jgi:hypothetical protein
MMRAMEMSKQKDDGIPADQVSICLLINQLIKFKRNLQIALIHLCGLGFTSVWGGFTSVALDSPLWPVNQV